jgi:hypothetical protein
MASRIRPNKLLTPNESKTSRHQFEHTIYLSARQLAVVDLALSKQQWQSGMDSERKLAATMPLA